MTQQRVRSVPKSFNCVCVTTSTYLPVLFFPSFLASILGFLHKSQSAHLFEKAYSSCPRSLMHACSFTKLYEHVKSRGDPAPDDQSIGANLMRIRVSYTDNFLGLLQGSKVQAL